jgi:hypothetical protein
MWQAYEFADVICGEPSGIKLACEVSNRMTRLALMSKVAFNEANARQHQMQRFQEVAAGVNYMVWEFLRLRLKTGLQSLTSALRMSFHKPLATARSVFSWARAASEPFSG